MLARVLFVLLAGVPVCRGTADAAYYDADGDDHNADFYDSYNDEIKFPQKFTTLVEATTRLKRRDLEKIRTLNPKEIIDVKGILNNILEGKKPKSFRGRRTARDYTDSYDYLENSINGQPEVSTDKKSSNQPVIKKWSPAVDVQKWSREQEYLDESSSQATVQHWSFENQPETSTYGKDDVIAEVRKLIPVRDREVPRRSSIVFGRRTQEVKTLSTTEETEETEDTLMYPLESTTYSNSDMQAQVRKLVQHWSSSSIGNMQESTTTATYRNSDMQAEVRKLVQHWSSSSSQETSSYNNAAMRADVRQLIQNWSSHGNVQHQSPSSNVQHQSLTSSVQQRGPSMPKGEMDQKNTGMQTDVSNLETWSPILDHKHWSTPANVQHRIPPDNVQHQNPSTNVQHQDPSMNIQHWSSSDNVQHRNTSVNVQHWSPTIDVQQWNLIAALNQENLPTIASETDPPVIDEAEGDYYFRAGPNKSSSCPTITTTPTTRRIDIDAIMAIIANLTYDYEWNLTEQFNKSIIEHGVPTCPWEKWGPGGAWTSTTGGTTLYSWDFENTSVVSKCFVCGLRTPEIPRNAHCADAFAGDFLPLMPIDAQSRGKIAGFRKYCRYIDTQNYIENPDEPRAIYGRFTGGCAVRWTDLTGVFTQRTCRSKFRPLLGKHFASKRMAKLELALVNVENGCIISPMATLLPVSRGISLYARFHACVCSTNWCNRATLEQASFYTLATVVLTYWLVHHP